MLLRPDDTYHHRLVPSDTTWRIACGAAAVPAPAPITAAGTDDEVDMYALYDTTAATLIPVLTSEEPAATA